MDIRKEGRRLLTTRAGRYFYKGLETVVKRGAINPDGSSGGN